MASIKGTKLGNHGGKGGGFKLMSDMKPAAAKGINKKAPKNARKPV